MTTSTLVFQCYYCVAAFGRRHQLLRHIAGHFCDDPFDQAQVRLDATGTGELDSIFQCVFCVDKTPYRRTWLTKHIYSQHLQDMRFHCKLCELPCDHMSSHDCLEVGQTPKWTYRCVRCRWRFSSAGDSARHYTENGKAHMIQCLKCNVNCDSAKEIFQH